MLIVGSDRLFEGSCCTILAHGNDPAAELRHKISYVTCYKDPSSQYFLCHRGRLVTIYFRVVAPALVVVLYSTMILNVTRMQQLKMRIESVEECTDGNARCLPEMTRIMMTSSARVTFPDSCSTKPSCPHSHPWEEKSYPQQVESLVLLIVFQADMPHPAHAHHTYHSIASCIVR